MIRPQRLGDFCMKFGVTVGAIGWILVFPLGQQWAAALLIAFVVFFLIGGVIFVWTL